MSNRGKGNRKAQRKRQRDRRKNMPSKQPVKVRLYDGNFSYYPVAYCKIHGAYLTQGLVDVHRCEKRNCTGLEKKVVMPDEPNSKDESKL